MAIERGTDGTSINMTGERVSLGPLRRDLIAVYQRWSNDLDTSRTLGLSWPTTMEQELSAYESRIAQRDAAWFTVHDLATSRPIGVCYLYEISHRHARASFGITIGEADFRGRGYGSEVTHMMLQYAFDDLGLENVMLTVYAFNTGGLRAYAKAGFREFGRRRRCSRMGADLHDLVYMECVASEFGRRSPAPSSGNR
jgi:diamine N-acetyltransferase